MSWQGLRGQDHVVEQFRRALAHGRLASTFLLVGPEGVGKRLFAKKLAQSVLCDTRDEALLDPCGECAACKQVLAGTHPDVLTVSRPADKSTIPLDLLIGDREHRMREGFCYDISLKPFSGKRRIAILDDADFLETEGANSLLKTLEEPPPKAIIMLLSTSLQRQLPTIRSRSQIIRFLPLPIDDVRELLLEHQLVEDAQQAQRGAELSEGSLQRAVEWSIEGVEEYRTTLLEHLAAGDFDLLVLAKATAGFVEGAGKDAAVKRTRLKGAIRLAEQFYREVQAQLTGSPSQADAQLLKVAQKTLRWWGRDTEGTTACLELCLEAHSHVEANANQSNLIEWWLDSLVQATR